MILETGDEMKKSTNVKADMTNWTMHKTHTGFKQLADMVMSIAGQLTKTKPPLYTSECWGAVYGEGEETKVHSHWVTLSLELVLLCQSTRGFKSSCVSRNKTNYMF